MADSTLVGLRWALKRSFLDYIARSPGGSASLGEGAVATEHREIVFAPVDGRPKIVADEGVTLTFGGSVTFVAHHGMLHLKISDPQVRIAEGLGEIFVIDHSEQGRLQLRLATFEISDHLIADGFEHWALADVRLTKEGSGLFNDVYPEGEKLEPLVIIIPATHDCA